MLRRTIHASLSCIAVLLLSGCAAVNLADQAQWLDVPSVAVADSPTTASAGASCAVTQPFQDQPPDDPHADPFGFGNWHINAERTLWVDIPPSGMWHTGGEKVIWIRPAGTQLRVSGQRLDAEAEPLVAEIPCCYPTGFQVTGLHFPSAGCWQISARAGDHALNFIIEVQDSPPQAVQKPNQVQNQEQKNAQH